jgi:hydroxymethylbilane synthase
METKRVVIGSRSSKLAMAQSAYVRDLLKKLYPAIDFQIKQIKTVGDKILDTALSKIGDKGLFTKEIEEALLRQEIDVAVHSMKDLPTELPDGLKIAAVPQRENPCDVLISKQGHAIRKLPKNAKIGTSSLRRRAQLLHIRNDLDVLDLRGNLDTRVKKLEEGLFDAIVLAYAGIKRMGFDLKLSVIPVEDILPQAGQGALCIETHKDRREVNDLVKALDHNDCHLSVDAERALLGGLGGGCQVPIGAYAEIRGSRIFIRAGVFSLDGKEAVKDEITGLKKDAKALGRKLAETLLANKVVRRILDELGKGIR